jgi:hypothetical protein
MKNIEGVTNSFCDSLPERRKKEGRDFQTNIQNTRRLCLIAQKSTSISGVERIQLERNWTDAILKLLSYGNSNVLKSFQYHLQMEEKSEYLLSQGMHLQQDEL